MALSWEERLKARGSSYTPSSSAIAQKALDSQVNVGSKLGAGQSIRHNQQTLAAMQSKDSAANALKIGSTGTPKEMLGGGRAMVNPTGGTNALAESLKVVPEKVSEVVSQVGQGVGNIVDKGKEIVSGASEAAKNIGKEAASQSKWASMSAAGKASAIGTAISMIMGQIGKGQDDPGSSGGRGSTPSAVSNLEEWRDYGY